uniref:Uncharacterized protein n=1 Tax=Attheya septentrionalis TaxID=420275 RepID=A0A7S2UPS0_9STRA
MLSNGTTHQNVTKKYQQGATSSSLASAAPPESAPALPARGEGEADMAILLDRAHARVLTADMMLTEMQDKHDKEKELWADRLEEGKCLVSELQTECETLEGALQESQHQQHADMEDAHAQIKDVEEERDEWQQRFQELQVEYKEAKEQPDWNVPPAPKDDDAPVNYDKVEELHDALRDQDRQLNETFQEVSRLEQVAEDYKVELEETQTNLEALQSELEEKDDRVRQMGMELEEKEQQVRNLSSTKSLMDGADEDDADLTEDKDRLAKRIESLESQVHTLEAERTTLQKCLDDAMQELEFVDEEVQGMNQLRTEKEDLEKRAQKLQRRLEARNQEILELQQQQQQLAIPEETSSPPGSETDGNGSKSAPSSPRSGKFDDFMETSRHFASRLRSKSVDRLRRTDTKDSDTHTSAAVASSARASPVSSNNNEQHNSNNMMREELDAERERVREMEDEWTTTKTDLAAKEKKNIELRRSLREAVGLLRPLQDHVADAEREKEELQDSLHNANERVTSLEKQLEDLQSVRTSNMPQDEAERAEQQNLQIEFNAKEREVTRLQEEVETVQKQLREAHVQVTELQEHLASERKSSELLREAEDSSSNESRNKNNNNKEIEELLEEVKARKFSEGSLRLLVKDSQAKTNASKKENKALIVEKTELEERLAEAENEVSKMEERLVLSHAELIQANAKFLESRTNNNDYDKAIVSKMQTELKSLKEQLQICEVELEKKDDELSKLTEELRQSELCLGTVTGDAQIMKKMKDGMKKMKDGTNRAQRHEAELGTLRKSVSSQESKITTLETELLATKGNLRDKEDTEKLLNSSLKEAVGLLKPLQGHVKSAEKEKRRLEKQLVESKRRVESGESSRTIGKQDQIETELMVVQREKKELESRLRRLESEKINLEEKVQNLAEEIVRERGESSSNGVSNGGKSSDKLTKLKAKLVEMTSRYDVTKAKLDRATDSNVSLLKDCKRLERAETENAQEIDRLRKQLRKATHDLDKAKIIARNALVKVEELTMASLQQMSRAQNHGSYSAGGSARTLSSMIQSGSVDQDEEIGPLLESIDTLEQQINGARQYNHESRGKSKREGMLHNHLEKHNQRSSPRSRQVTTSKR